MTKNKVLIITHSKDNQSIDTVSELLKQAGVVPVRFNTDLFPTKVQIATHQNNNGNESTLITENGDVVKGDEILVDLVSPILSCKRFTCRHGHTAQATFCRRKQANHFGLPR